MDYLYFQHVPASRDLFGLVKMDALAAKPKQVDTVKPLTPSN